MQSSTISTPAEHMFLGVALTEDEKTEIQPSKQISAQRINNLRVMLGGI